LPEANHIIEVSRMLDLSVQHLELTPTQHALYTQFQGILWETRRAFFIAHDLHREVTDHLNAGPNIPQPSRLWMDYGSNNQVNTAMLNIHDSLRIEMGFLNQHKQEFQNAFRIGSKL